MAMGVDVDFGGNGAPGFVDEDDGLVMPPIAAAVMPGFDELFQLVGPVMHRAGDPVIPYQLGRGTFGAVFLCQLRDGAAARIRELPAGIISEPSRRHLLIPDILFACKFVVLPDAEADEVYGKEVSAAMEFDRRIAGGEWETLARATLTSTIYGWMDTPYEPATGARMVMPYPKPEDAAVPVRLIRTVMELNFNSIPGADLSRLPVFAGVPPMRRFAFRDDTTGALNAFDLPNVRRATDAELAGTADLCGAAVRHPDEARYMAVQVLLGLHTLHSNHHVHRDIKPENVLTWADWPYRGVPAAGAHMDPWVKVTDFGMLRVDNADIKTLDVGSRAYNPPELRSQAPRAIVRDDGSIKSGAAYDGQKFDVFAAGCMLYALLAGRQPPGSPLHGYPGRFVDSTGAGMERLSPLAVALLGRMCDTNPATRCSALEALQHPYFDGVAVPAAMWPPGAAAGLPHGIRRAAGAGAPAPADAARGIAGGAGAAPV